VSSENIQFNKESQTEKSTKEKTREQHRQEVERITDRLELVIDEGIKEAVTKRREWQIENLKIQKKMIDLLDAFYQGRKISFESMITFRYIGAYGEFRLQSFGAETMELMTPEEQEQKRLEYKKELDDFAQFLRERYFAE